MIEFILNNETIRTDAPSGSLLLDFIRYDRTLTGTKIGCREGDCGACTVLVGRLSSGKMVYRQVTSCLTPLINAHGTHVVSIEGLNMDELSPVQNHMIEESGTQCGFCTVGFVVSLSGYCLSHSPPSIEGAIASIDGNICRCTGYKSIERAAGKLVDDLNRKDLAENMAWLVRNQFIPDYFLSIPARLERIPPLNIPKNGHIVVGGGTDLYVQQHDRLADAEVMGISSIPGFGSIRYDDGRCILGGGTTVTDLLESVELQTAIPRLADYIKLVASSPIRNIATLAGNLVNASPIGDLSLIFLALDAMLHIRKNDESRVLPLRSFYKGYKKMDLGSGELIAGISFPMPGPNSHFHMEKVSKRTYLDIASVNSAALISMTDDTITSARISAGGVAPIPLYLQRTSNFLDGKKLSVSTLRAANEVMQEEISPISDVRGSSAYKRLLLRQLLYAHFLELFPNLIKLRELL